MTATPVPATTTVLSAADVERLELSVRGDLIGAIGSLAALREGRAHEVRGHATWHDYIEATFGDLIAELRMPPAERQELVLSMRTDPAGASSLRSIAAKLGVGLGTISADVADLRRVGRLDAEPAKVLGSDGVQRPARGTSRPTTPADAPLAAPTGKLWQQAAEYLRRAGDGLLPGYEAGLTLVDLARVMAITEGSASGLLSYLTAPSRGLAVRLDDTRRGQRVHVLTAAGRAVLGALAAAAETAAAG